MNLEIRDSVADVNDSLRTATDKELSRSILSWLSALDLSTNLSTARSKRQEDTGLWLVESSTFLDWRIAPCSFLWLHGKAGSGKTILSSTVAWSLLKENETKTVVAYFYFDYQTREKQLFESFLKSIIVQLLRSNNDTFKFLDGLYSAHSRERTRPTIQDLKGTLRRMIDKIASIHLVIDALDECEDRASLLKDLEDLLNWKQRNIHIFATSRRETDIEDSLIKVATDEISLEVSVVDADILCYVRHQLKHDIKLPKWPEDIRMEIETALLKGANGMLRWVICQLDAVRGYIKFGLLRKTLTSLLKTLDETYASILRRIPKEHVEDARRILCRLICSFHPLSIQEVADTVAIMTEGKPYYDGENELREPRDILTICFGLVTTTDSTRYNEIISQIIHIEELRLAHFSVKESLVSVVLVLPRPLSLHLRNVLPTPFWQACL